MNDPSQQLERIVAYLDGELSAEESAQVEQQLATDEDFRQELQGAERAWTALDELPMAQVGESFAQTTMEMVVTAARNDIQTRDDRPASAAAQPQSEGRLAGDDGGAVRGVGLSHFLEQPQPPAACRSAGHPQRRHLFAIPKCRVSYSNSIACWAKATSFRKPKSSRLRPRRPFFEQVSAEDGREDWLEMLPDDKKIVLRAKLNRFRDLSSQRQTEMRQLHQKLLASGERDQLLTTMYRYQQWLSELSQSQQYEYRELDASKRAVRVAREMEQAANDQQFELTQKQLQRLLRRIRPHIQKVVQRIRKLSSKSLLRCRNAINGISAPDRNPSK